jgi:assimilatory nitrate reductase catalytic subunit
VDAIRRLLLTPTGTPPAAGGVTDRVVCNCLNVGQRAIEKALWSLPDSPADSLATLQGRLQCGTGCGSCLPELKRMIAGRERAPAASMETAA